MSGNELEKLVEQEVTGKKSEASEPDELAPLRPEIEEALKSIKEVSSTGESALKDAYAKLEAYAVKRLPLLIKTNVEEAVQSEIREAIINAVRPLNESVAAAIRDVERCRSKVNGMCSNRRLIAGQMVTGLTVFAIGALVLFGVMGDTLKYAKWGRQVEIKISSYGPQTRRILLRDFGQP